MVKRCFPANIAHIRQYSVLEMGKGLNSKQEPTKLASIRHGDVKGIWISFCIHYFQHKCFLAMNYRCFYTQMINPVQSRFM